MHACMQAFMDSTGSLWQQGAPPGIVSVGDRLTTSVARCRVCRKTVCARTAQLIPDMLTLLCKIVTVRVSARAPMPCACACWMLCTDAWLHMHPTCCPCMHASLRQVAVCPGASCRITGATTCVAPLMLVPCCRQAYRQAGASLRPLAPPPLPRGRAPPPGPASTARTARTAWG